MWRGCRPSSPNQQSPPQPQPTNQINENPSVNFHPFQPIRKLLSNPISSVPSTLPIRQHPAGSPQQSPGRSFSGYWLSGVESCEVFDWAAQAQATWPLVAGAVARSSSSRYRVARRAGDCLNQSPPQPPQPPTPKWKSNAPSLMKSFKSFHFTPNARFPT